jgi:DNA polymerase III subunit gamma/tau
MSYLVLARKYRSNTFDEVVGQEHIAQTLVNAIKSGRVAHAFLFTGTRGVGKTTMARILSKALNCLSAEGPTDQPCNECEACLAISRGEDMDVIEIDGASNRGIDEIRELRANAIFSPSRCRYKIYYIDEVHMLTREAFNALLKTLEEPPAHVKFIFSTTETQKIPATILSRCQRFDFRNISTRAIADHLGMLCKSEKVNATDDALFRVSKAASGSMRDALSLLDQLISGSGEVTDEGVVRILGTPSDERMNAIVSAIAASDPAAALGALAEVLQSGVMLNSVVTALGDVYRNMMLVDTCGAESDLIELPEMERKAICELAGRFSTPVLVHALGLIQTAGRNIRGSSVARGLVEATLVRLAQSEKFINPENIVERLEQLSSGGPDAGQKKKHL